MIGTISLTRSLSPRRLYRGALRNRLSLVLLTAAFLLPRLGVSADEKISFTTLDGTEYENVTVTRRTDEGLVIRHSNGMASIAFESLPSDLQSKYGYDVKAAEKARETRLQQEGERRRTQMKQEQMRAAEHRKEEEPSRIMTLKIHEVADGYLVCNRTRNIYSDKGAPDPPSEFKDIIIVGHPSIESLAEDERFSAQLVQGEPMDHYGRKLRSWRIVKLCPEYDE